jgi:hypothetical protein
LSEQEDAFTIANEASSPIILQFFLQNLQIGANTGCIRGKISTGSLILFICKIGLKTKNHSAQQHLGRKYQRNPTTVFISPPQT